ncbi:Restriction endonuclease fold toxin 5 [Paraburkholderia fungorum]|uniref:Restriction endonuclease fold toxin 5 n=1 Tax=Paraburkholderia fungorum TaxID=134537 RepID=A0A1H0YWH0_9BURK|nr:restriction endonuclease fold toxin 5 domain-containing protein [Paraburkholderia fungorum]SDQ19503.1 Restriction endonuclease fold toxin 5 [Paraburkholderia fungorum]
MVVLAIPLVEAAGAVLAEAFSALVGGTATAAILALPGDHAEDESKTQPVVRTMPKTDEPCKKCPPDAGNRVTRNWNMSDTSRAYQAQVTGFAAGTEWNFSGLDFDGFRTSLCQLEEAKAKYDQFFDGDTGEPKMFYEVFGVRKMQTQALAQNTVAISNPPTQLHWYFMQPMSYRYFTQLFQSTAPLIRTELRPLQ